MHVYDNGMIRFHKCGQQRPSMSWGRVSLGGDGVAMGERTEGNNI